MISDNYLLSFIRHRMEEMGYSKYHFETVLVELVGAGAKKEIKAYNEYYYLISKSVPDNTVIASDMHYFKAKDYGDCVLHGIQEFSGMITAVRDAADAKLEFVRVIIEY